jgi:integrase
VASRHEENPRRPIVTHHEFQRRLAAAPSVNPSVETVLILADSTGHRINSVRMLRWSDIDFQANTIRWRGDQDKIGHEHVTPMVQVARNALLRELRRQCTIGDSG